MVTVQVAEQIGTAADEDGAGRRRSSGITVSMLVLSAAGVLIGLLTFALGQWVDARTDATHLVDTADCRMIAMTSGESLDSSNCSEPTDPSPVVVGDSADAQGALPAPSMLMPSRVVTAPGLWIHSILQSVG